MNGGVYIPFMFSDDCILYISWEVTASFSVLCSIYWWKLLLPSPSHSGVGISASVPSPDNHHSTALETSSSHKLYRTGGPNGTAASCPPPSVSEPYSPPKVTMTCCVPFRNSKIGKAQSYRVFIDAVPLIRCIFVHSLHKVQKIIVW
jgi:hypothetical protein